MILVITFIVMLALPIIGVTIYTKIMFKKSYFSPILKDLLPESEKKRNHNKLKLLQDDINIIIHNVNGWLQLFTFYTSFHFLLNIFQLNYHYSVFIPFIKIIPLLNQLLLFPQFYQLFSYQ